jgi:hypothetical protein
VVSFLIAAGFFVLAAKLGVGTPTVSIRITPLAAAVSVLAILLSAAPMAAPEQPAPITEVRMKYFLAGAPGAPSEELVLRADGTAAYVGSGHVERPGRFTGRLEKEQFARLAALIERESFFDLKSSYRSMRTHDSMVILTVKRGGVEKQVVDYGNQEPIGLWSVQRAVLSFRAEVVWRQQ